MTWNVIKTSYAWPSYGRFSTNFTGMESELDSIKRLIHELKSFTFWDRVFRWGRIRGLLVEANADFQKLIHGQETIRKLNHELDLERNKVKAYEASQIDLKLLRAEKESLLKEKTTLENKNDVFLKRGTEISNDLTQARQKVETLEVEIRKLSEENTRFRSTDEQRKRQYEDFITNLNETIKRNHAEREAEKKELHELEIKKLRKLKETWLNHEENVRTRIKNICTRHGVEYVDKVPFKGKPDNTLKINGEYVILDAKSPGGDDLSNFPTYLKTQAESVSKYIKEDDVRKDVFLVVPTNTLDVLDRFEYMLADYNVYIISIDSLEPIILTLQKIEAYEFAEQLSPEERENICRVIGKFVHLSKRRIQIDGFFAKQFFELVYRSEADLPKDILEKVVDFEMAEKLNPPIERRAKVISIKELENDTNKLKGEANLKGIVTEDNLLSQGINKLPLYSTQSQSADKSQSKLFDS